MLNKWTTFRLTKETLEKINKTIMELYLYGLKISKEDLISYSLKKMKEDPEWKKKLLSVKKMQQKKS